LIITGEHLDEYRHNGWTLVKGLFSRDEVERLIEHYMAMSAANREKNGAPSESEAEMDPLKLYPRMLQMHRWDDMSLRWLVDARLNECMTAILGREPFAVQTMIYFKPAGARGQALHQDQFYLRAKPGTCLAAWMALDRCDEENGCMRVAVGQPDLPVLCTEKANTTISFTDVTVPVPEDVPVVPAIMDPGDVLFFNGSVIHGSYPNTSRDRFRRALIGHYIAGEAKQVHQGYHPVLRMDGTPIEFGSSEHGGTCGTWVERDGRPAVELTAVG
jgi:phytanoyl-CoA hydroxylase